MRAPDRARVTNCAFTNQQLRHARICSMGQMVASISHEVQQPLAAIALHAQAALRCLEQPQPTIAQASAALRTVLEATARAAELLRSVRMLAQDSATPDLAPARAACPLHAAMHALLPLLRGELDRHRILLRLHLAGAAPDVLADPVQLQQVLLNLINNAIDALRGIDHQPRQLIIAARADGPGHTLITVADNGSGLPPGDPQRLFDPLYTTKRDGIGMGLAICRAIVEAHGGAIWAGHGAGGGSVFAVRLPCPASAAPRRPASDGVHYGQGMASWAEVCP